MQITGWWKCNSHHDVEQCTILPIRAKAVNELYKSLS